MKALLVGAGGMGRAWAGNIARNPDCRLAGWVDIRPGAAEEASSALGFEGVTTGCDLEKLIHTVSPDFVVDVSSPEAHCEVTLTALKNGIPVLGEKPMASTLEDARRMVKASESSGKLYMVSQSRRYDKGLVTLRKAVRNHLGDIGILDADFYIGAHFGGFRDEMESPLLLDMAIHTFDAARFLCGSDPVSVQAEEFNPSWSWYRGNACAFASFEMSNGARFQYRGSWCAEGHPTSWDADWRIVGSNGSARWERNGEVLVDLPTGEGFMRASETSVLEQEEIAGGIEGSLDEFLTALKTGCTPQGECHDNIKSLSMVFAAKKAAALGCRISVES